MLHSFIYEKDDHLVNIFALVSLIVWHSCVIDIILLPAW
jgi:hypothetical protein